MCQCQFQSEINSITFGCCSACVWMSVFRIYVCVFASGRINFGNNIEVKIRNKIDLSDLIRHQYHFYFRMYIISILIRWILFVPFYNFFIKFFPLKHITVSFFLPFFQGGKSSAVFVVLLFFVALSILTFKLRFIEMMFNLTYFLANVCMCLSLFFIFIYMML